MAGIHIQIRPLVDFYAHIFIDKCLKGPGIVSIPLMLGCSPFFYCVAVQSFPNRGSIVLRFYGLLTSVFRNRLCCDIVPLNLILHQSRDFIGGFG